MSLFDYTPVRSEWIRRQASQGLSVPASAITQTRLWRVIHIPPGEGFLRWSLCLSTWSSWEKPEPCQAYASESLPFIVCLNSSISRRKSCWRRETQKAYTKNTAQLTAKAANRNGRFSGGSWACSSWICSNTNVIDQHTIGLGLPPGPSQGQPHLAQPVLRIQYGHPLGHQVGEKDQEGQEGK